jgi:hypothetical protein
VFQHLRFSSRVPAVVFQHLRFSSRVPFVLQFVFVLQHLFVCIWVAASVRVAASVLSKQSIAINDNLEQLRHPFVIAISPTRDFT